MLKRALLLLPVLFFAVNIAMAQDDDLPPPSSQPKGPPPATTDKNKTPEDYTGFQKTKKKIDWSKFIIEPDFDLNIQQGRVDAGISPLVGYEVYTNLYAGGELTYLYTGFSGLQVDVPPASLYNIRKVNFQTYGGGVFLQYSIWHGIFARAKFEVLERNMSNMDTDPYPINPNNYNEGWIFPRIQVTIPDLLIGAGYNLLRSKNVFFPIMVSYNLLQGVSNAEYSIYPHAWVIQLGFVDIF